MVDRAALVHEVGIGEASWPKTMTSQLVAGIEPIGWFAREGGRRVDRDDRTTNHGRVDGRRDQLRAATTSGLRARSRSAARPPAAA